MQFWKVFMQSCEIFFMQYKQIFKPLTFTHPDFRPASRSRVEMNMALTLIQKRNPSLLLNNLHCLWYPCMASRYSQSAVVCPWQCMNLWFPSSRVPWRLHPYLSSIVQWLLRLEGVHSPVIWSALSVHSLAFKGILTLNTSDKHLVTSFQNSWILGHSHRQWRRVPFSVFRTNVQNVIGHMMEPDGCYIGSYEPFILQKFKVCVCLFRLLYKVASAHWA